jgi:hypothetical protein
MAVTEAEVEIRCPVGPRRLFALMIDRGERPRKADGNLIEFVCRDCAKRLRQSDPTVDYVLHRYDIAGELIETEVTH